MGIMNDTMQCFQESIIAHKDIYLHKPLKYLLSDLVIPVKSYSTEVTVRPSDAITSIDFYFIHWNEVMNNVFFSKRQYLDMNILFEEPIAKKKADSLWRDSKCEWLDAEKLFYNNKIIKDIRIYKRNFQIGKKVTDSINRLKDSILKAEIDEKPIHDTSKYINDFYNLYGSKFNGQKLNNLLKALRIPIKSYTVNIERIPSTNITITYIIRKIFLSIFSKADLTNNKIILANQYFEICIEFKEKVYTTDKQGCENDIRYDFGEPEKLFFGNKIIGDIYIDQKRIFLTN
jgi:hypothetical protein